MSKTEGVNGYNISRSWFNFCFDNPEKIKPIHTAIYLFAMEHCNRLGWKEKFGFPSQMAMEAIGVKSWHVYIKAFNQLIEWGFFILIERSKNQYSSNIIALSYFNKAPNKALDKALTKHSSKQVQSTQQSIDSIIKQINNKQINKEQINKLQNSINNFLNSKSENASDSLMMYTREEMKSFLESDSGLRQKCESDLKLNDESRQEYIEKFLVHLADYRKTRFDAKEHFWNWLKKQPKIDEKQKKPKKEKYYIIRSGTETDTIHHRSYEVNERKLVEAGKCELVEIVYK